MKMFVAGEWIDRGEKIEVRSPFDGSVIDTVPKAQEADIERALDAAVAGAEAMRQLSGYERYQILHRAAERMREQQEELGRLISREEGKTLREGVGEVGRAAETIELSAEEAKRIAGEVLPIDGASNGKGKLGFTLRVPCGVVVAITPFNFPLNLPCHKVGPALAAGNSVILKPASDTPLSALRLVEILLEAGLPPLGISCLTGSGRAVGDRLCTDPRVRKISFTGSRDVGEQIAKMAGLKRVTMELGSNCPVIVMDDADLNQAVEATAISGFANAGQVCISAQRVIATGRVYSDFLDRLRVRVEQITAGDPLDSATTMGPMIREADAERVESWIHEAVDGGAKLVVGGARRSTLHLPTLLADVDPAMRVSREELFGPAVAVSRVSDIEEAIRLANSTNYGLSASIFTESLDHAMRFAKSVASGNIHINWGPAWRADLMPYGGLKESGFGKEGPRYAIEEMTEVKSVIVH